MFNKKEKANKVSKENLNALASTLQTKSRFKVKALREVVCCKNVNAVPDDHIEIINGRKVLCRTMYVSDMPRRSTFVNTFDVLLHCPYANTSVFINPIPEGDSVKDLNSQITELDAESSSAGGKVNKARKTRRLQAEAEGLCDAIDSGENSMFNVSILINVFANNYIDLNKRTDDLRYNAKSKGIILSTFYGNQEEAFLASLPINNNKKLAPLKPMDKYSLATIFPYTKGEFGHSTGAPLGRNLDTGKLVHYNLFDRSMNGYNMVLVGMTRAGKSTTVKIIIKRNIYPGGPSFVILDAEGEYGLVTAELGGENIVISNDSPTIINTFDVDIEYKLNKITGLEIETLDLKEKVSIVTNNIMTMARGSDPDKALIDDATRGIIKEIVQEAYTRCNIFDGDISSLYEVVNGVKKKKPCPTLSSWYEILVEDVPDSIRNRYINTSHKDRYEYLQQVMKDYVRVCNGSRLYFDGQSTVSLGTDAPIINFDIHALNEKYERPVAQTILMEWMWEVKCKKNSENPAKSQEIVTIFDETHYLLPYPEARTGITNYYRRAAKKNVAVITATQNLNDYMLYPDSHAIFTNAATKMILRCSDKEKSAMSTLLNLTDSEIECVLRASKGDTYIVSGNNKAFVHIDRLPSEIALTETDMSVRKELLESGQSTVA